MPFFPFRTGPNRAGLSFSLHSFQECRSLTLPLLCSIFFLECIRFPRCRAGLPSKDRLFSVGASYVYFPFLPWRYPVSSGNVIPFFSSPQMVSYVSWVPSGVLRWSLFLSKWPLLFLDIVVPPRCSLCRRNLFPFPKPATASLVQRVALFPLSEYQPPHKLNCASFVSSWSVSPLLR